MKHDQYLDLIENGEEWVRSGNSSKLVPYYKRLHFKDIPRRHRLPLANLAYRGGLVTTALKILAPVMAQENVFRATPQETAEYCVSLQKIGSISECLKRLEDLDEDTNPKILLYRAFCLFNQWDYTSAVPLLRRYVEKKQLTEYDQIIGHLNLTASLINTRNFEEAQSSLKKVRTYAIENNLGRIHANTLELEAQIHIDHKDYAQAQKMLNEAIHFIGSDQSYDLLFVKKWLLVIEARKKQSLAPIHEYRQLAHRHNHWESLRDADYQELLISYDEDLANKLYFCTPYEEYRKRLTETIPNFHIQENGYTLGNKEKTLHLESGQFKGGPLLKPGKLLHKALYALNRDSYRPIRIGSLHAQIFEDDFFDPYSSPNKIHQIIHRLGNELKKAQVPSVIDHTEHGYHFQIDLEKTGVQYSNATAFKDQHLHNIEQLRLIFGDQPFKIREAIEKTNIPATTLNRYINLAIEKGLLEKIGAGPKTSYCFLTERGRKAS